MSSNPFPPSRTSTVSSLASSAYSYSGLGHKRGISETSPTRPSVHSDGLHKSQVAPSDYTSIRQSLRPLPQPPNARTHLSKSRPLPSEFSSENSFQEIRSSLDDPPYPDAPSQPFKDRINTSRLRRQDSVTPTSSSANSLSTRSYDHQSKPHQSNFSTPDLVEFKKSSTPYLKNLSRFVQAEESEDFTTAPTTPSVAGLSGRRQLKRTGSVRPQKNNGSSELSRGSAWAENNWMEKQRQFLQAYEYLCHIGEAKEWIEDVIHKTLPPIVQLEEALRNGITLAEIVQAFYPDRAIKIFRDPKLQYRHSDNIALFFRFLSDMELPELFRFELIDLYEKKNIPKVIHCIHALSWLLYRKGLVDFRIGNLVGQLEFEHHELEETQRGLDKAGVSMPSFAGMGASFGAEIEAPPEPVESEDDRIARELQELQEVIVDLQSQIRGSAVRVRLGDMMQSLWDSESSIADLQSLARANWAREVAIYRSSMRRSAILVQAAARGCIARRSQEKSLACCRSEQPDIVRLQSTIRALQTRSKVRTIKHLARKEFTNIQSLQANIRGALERKRVDDQYEESRLAAMTLDRLQASIRGRLIRLHLQNEQEALSISQNSVLHLQSATRGAAARHEHQSRLQDLQNHHTSCSRMQAASKGFLSRRHIQDTRSILLRSQHSTTELQSFCRGKLVRQSLSNLGLRLASFVPEFVKLQAFCNGHLVRARQQALQGSLRNETSAFVTLQSIIRGASIRVQTHQLRDELSDHLLLTLQIQSLVRAMLLRSEIGRDLADLETEEDAIVKFQAATRANLVRRKFIEKQRFFKENMEKVVKVQSFVRARLQGEAYKSLTTGNNPPVGTVKNFVHLLNDSNFDFDEEVEFERLRKTVVQHVRQNEMADQYISQLDIKIALLVKNKITLDEVIRHQKHFGSAAGSLLTNKELSSRDPFDLKALNKNSRQKLEHYQELFFILQTQPQYLSRIFRRAREQATPEKEGERLKHLMMGLFGYAQKRREEYYLIKLISRSLKEEIEHSSTLQEYLRSNFFWTKLFSAYTKSPRDRKYMRDLLGPIVRDQIIDNPELDLESDPMQIYLSAIENEELRTGQRSSRNPDIPREAAIRDPETKRTFITHLQDLRDIADQLFLSLEEQLHKMPFGVRYIAQQMYNALMARFPQEEQGHILQIVGHWTWKNYLQPALTEPEKYGVVDRGLPQEQKRNIGEVSRVVGQVAAGRLFGGENVFLQPLNPYVAESIQRLGEIWSNGKYRATAALLNYC